MLKSIKTKFDLDFLKGSALISIGSAFAQVLGFVFFIVLADAFPSSDYGQIQYFISVSSVVGIMTQPFGQHTLARFVGKYKHDERKLQSILSNGFFILIVLFGITLLFAVPVISGMVRTNMAIFAIFFGSTLFYTYWGLTRGFLEAKKLTIAYIFSNLVQIIAVMVLIYVLKNPSITLVLVIYGFSYLLPLAMLVILSPLPVRVSVRDINREALKEVLVFSIPIWVSHMSHVALIQVDILLLEKFVTLGELGAYALTRTLANVFLFIPNGISTLLMPKFASDRNNRDLGLLFRMLVLSTSGNLFVFVVYAVSIRWVTLTFFGADYLVNLIVSVIYAFGIITAGIYSIVVSYAVGIDRPGAESVGRIVAVIALFVFGFWLIPIQGALGASIAILVAMIGALVTTSYLVLRMKVPLTPKDNMI